MSETFKTGGEKPAEGEGAFHLGAPAEMDGNYDSEKPKVKPVGELTPKEASKEYLDLLMDLSANFTSAEGKSSRAARYDRDGNIKIISSGYEGGDRRIVGQIYETATGKKFREEKSKLNDGKWEDQHIDRELALSLADNIISAESDWRAAGESTTIEAEQEEKEALEKDADAARRKLAKIGHGVFGGIKTAIHTTLHNREYNKSLNLARREPQTEAEKRTARANAKLQKALEAAYSEEYGYGNHSLRYENDARSKAHIEQVNQEFNDKFFEGSRRAKIDRAIELRRELENKKIIKQKKNEEIAA